VTKRSQVSVPRSPLSDEARLASPEYQHRGGQHRLAPVAVGQRTDGERTQHQSHEAGGKERPQTRHREAPFHPDCRRDKSDERRVEAVNCDDEKAHEEQPSL
jgi:hypothetical protein